jgi:hypothetical protein
LGIISHGAGRGSGRHTKGYHIKASRPLPFFSFSSLPIFVFLVAEYSGLGIYSSSHIPPEAGLDRNLFLFLLFSPLRFPTPFLIWTMPRPTWGNLSSDPALIPGHIDRILGASSSDIVKHILRNYEKRTTLVFRDITTAKLGGEASKIAAVIQRCGELEDNGCEFCLRGGEGLTFTQCVRIPGEQYGKCANCIYRKQKCSLGICKYRQ